MQEPANGIWASIPSNALNGSLLSAIISKGTINFYGAAHIQVACSHCDHDQLYGADEVQNYKAM